MFSKLKENFNNLFVLIQRPEMSILPGHLAFFLVLSIIPLFLIVMLITTLFVGTGETIIDLIYTTFPQDVSNVLVPIITRDLNLNILVLILVSIYIASSGLYSVIIAANTLYDNNIEKTLWHRLKALVLTIFLLMLFFFILVVLAFGNIIMSYLGSLIDSQLILDYLNMAYLILKYPFAFVFIFLIISLIYTFAPDNNIGPRSTVVGGFFTTLAWVLTTLLYSFWVDNFAHYDIFYGSLSTIIILMLWVYLLSYSFVLGLAINANRFLNKRGSYETSSK